MRIPATPLIFLSSFFGYETEPIIDDSLQKAFETPLFAPEPGAKNLPSCDDPTIKSNIEKSQYQYLVVGAGAGGGTVASRLASEGYTVGLIEAGRDHVNINTTIPLYLIRASEDPVIALDYEVDHYPYKSADDPKRVTAWYPRAQGIGGSTIHNALINLIPHKWDFEQIRKMFDDDSWSWQNMAQYYSKIEKNEYLPQGIGLPIGHGYNGWVETQTPPLSLLTDYPDPQLADVFTAIQGGKPPVANADYNDWRNDEAEGGAFIILTKQANGTRLTVRDRVADVRSRFPERLKLITETMATKILTCRTEQGNIQAYGVEAWVGANLLNVARGFKGKGKGIKMVKQWYARNEVILSAGPYESPRLMMLSGLGDREQLKKHNLTTLVHLPGVGQNLQDRVEETTVFHLKQDHKFFANCTFGYDVDTDPCLKEWFAGGRKNLYSAGAALWAWSYKSDPKLPYRDVWNFWGPASFLGYYKGWGEDARKVKNAMVNVILKAHTAAQGWVRLTSADPQSVLDINKNEFVTPESLKDLEVVKDGMKFTKKWVDETPLFNKHIKSIPWPPASVKTDEQYKQFIRDNQWGHHACCTNKIGADNDNMAVLNGDFQVRGVHNLRVVDLSSWPTIPGMFVTTPMYMIAEKAAEVIGDHAELQDKGPSYL